MATLNQLRDALHKQPFWPIQLRLADGRACIVQHPDFISTPPGNLGLEAHLYTARPSATTKVVSGQRKIDGNHCHIMI
jgi:hypothetical protein